MGKKSKRQKQEETTTVSIATPTWNRRERFPNIIKCFEHQDYPKHLIEWVIVDDGDETVEDLVAHIPNVNYHRLDEKLPLGKKRNVMNDLCTGDIIVYMDDDDYYPPDRVSHAVSRLKSRTGVLVAAGSEMYSYSQFRKQIFKFGPYGKQHGTANSFAFKRELLDQTRYDDEATHAEEKAFLKNWSIPMVQLDPMKTLLCISHDKNTFDKESMFDRVRQTNTICQTSLKLHQFIKNKEVRDGFI